MAAGSLIHRHMDSEANLEVVALECWCGILFHVFLGSCSLLERIALAGGMLWKGIVVQSGSYFWG